MTSFRHALMFSMLATGTAMLACGPAHAASVVSSNFATGADGWTNGSFNSLGATTPVIYSALGQFVQVSDIYGYNAFVAPSAYLGNKSAAFGGTFRFDLADAFNDGTAYAPFTLLGAGQLLYAVPSVVPSTSSAALTTYSTTLIGANFRTGDLGAGAVATDAQLQSVLASLDRIGINADWSSGEDLVTLDNVALSCTVASCDIGGVTGAIPEPATWAMMLIGFGAIGGAMRARRRVSISYG